jgi:hypothetical protein
MNSLHNVEEIIDFQPEIHQYEDLTIRSRKINNYTGVMTLYGPHVIKYIAESVRIRANDQFSFSNAVNKLLFQKIIGNRFQFEFNQHIKIEKEIILDKIELLLNQGYEFSKIKQQIQQDKKEFYNYELDVKIEIANLSTHGLSFETKLFTCPGQSGSILARHLMPSSLHHYFQTRDFMGLITFSHLVDSREPEKPFRFPEGVPREHRFDWFLHFKILDYRILAEQRASSDIADEIISSIREDHAFFLTKLSLNSYPCSIRLIENYLKVVHMSYFIQELEEKVERERQEKKRQRQQFLQFLKNKKISDSEIEEFMKSLDEKPEKTE